MQNLLLRNFLFTLLQPGIVVGLIPFLLLRYNQELLAGISNWNHYLGIFLFLIGFNLMAACILSFATRGKGTLSPADPTQNLVIEGLYKYSRNPMYIGVLLMLIGQTVFFFSTMLFVYSVIVFFGFHYFITRVEEPRLQKDFNGAYLAYCKKVRRWI